MPQDRSSNLFDIELLKAGLRLVAVVEGELVFVRPPGNKPKPAASLEPVILPFQKKKRTG